jgi:alpha-glucosidase
MPYLYTTAEEMSRTGLPIMRPLFLEFPNATSDGHPIDLDAGSEFLFGPSLLVAPNPSPEEVAPYEVQLPPGVWYDYWTGERLDRRTQTGTRDLEIRDAKQQPNKPLVITPTLADLPIYVREGTILPVAPLTQSTNEVPDGPLTLRVYPGQNCAGDLYQDDGKSFAFSTGSYLRIHLTCTENPDGTLGLHIGAPQGSFAPWWKQLRIEAYGWTSKAHQAVTPQGTQPLQQSGRAWALTLPAPSAATDLSFE